MNSSAADAPIVARTIRNVIWSGFTQITFRKCRPTRTKDTIWTAEKRFPIAVSTFGLTLSEIEFKLNKKWNLQTKLFHI